MSQGEQGPAGSGSKETRVTNIEMSERGVRGLLKGPAVTALLLDIADEIARDASTAAKGRKYETGLKKNRPKRNVAVVRSNFEAAYYIEAAKGYLGRAAQKKRR